MSVEKNRVKIGARALSEDALGNLLPNNKEISNRIKNIRQFAWKYKKEKEELSKGKDWYQNYLAKELDRNQNNIFSILGGRGSGKTSVLLTIKNRLTNQNTNDIMLPLIIPENMGDSSDILGWTICAFEKNIKDIEDYVEKNLDYNKCPKFGFFKNCRKNEKNILREKFGELLKYYTYINKEYRQLLNVFYDGFNEYKEKTKEVINAERELLNKFEEFIDTLIEVKKEVHKIEEEPLIYIFFDDVDLCTERCLEIVNMILKYLSNPNIVVFVSGDYSTFSETLTINLLKKDGLLMNCQDYFDKEERGKEALNVRKQLAKDILKKALPPAYRFKMPTFNNKAKADFKFSTSEDDRDNIQEQYESLLELIKIKLLNIEKNNKENFLYYNNTLIEIYFNIFDSNPRSLMNIYYFLYGLEENQDDDKNRRQCEILKDFLNIIIDSNPRFGEMEEHIVPYIIDIKDNLEETFVNYEYIKELYYNDLNKEGEKVLEKYVSIFLLANFIENVIARKVKRSIHHIDIFIEMVNSANRNNLIPKQDDSEFILALYSKVNETLGRVNSNQSDHYKITYFTQTYFEILFDLSSKKDTKNIDDKKIRNIFLPSIRKQDKWATDNIDIIFKATCNPEHLLSKAINECYDNQIKEFDIEMRHRISEELSKLFNDYLEKIRKLGRKKSISIGNSIKVSIGIEKYLHKILEINNLLNVDISDLDEKIRVVKDAIDDSNDEVFYNFGNMTVYEIPEIFIRRFNSLNIEINDEDTVKQIEIIKEIIDPRNNGTISVKDYESLRKNIRRLLRNSSRNYGSRYMAQIDYLTEMLKDFSSKKLVDSSGNDGNNNKDMEQLLAMMEKNVLLRFSLNMLKREKYIIENENTYKKLISMKEALKSLINKNTLVRNVIKNKQEEIELLKIEKEDNENV